MNNFTPEEQWSRLSSCVCGDGSSTSATAGVLRQCRYIQPPYSRARWNVWQSSQPKPTIMFLLCSCERNKPNRAHVREQLQPTHKNKSSLNSPSVYFLFSASWVSSPLVTLSILSGNLLLRRCVSALCIVAVLCSKVRTVLCFDFTCLSELCLPPLTLFLFLWYFFLVKVN